MCNGVDLIGYYVFYEGFMILVYGIYNIESFVVYEVYWKCFVVDFLGCENYEFV